MRVGSLFSGIGGLDLGLERAGMTVVWQSEINPYASRVLTKHWPSVPNLGDITTIDWSTVEPVDLICGGYPCQPFSTAGKRAGANDARHLWPYFATALRLLRPRFALLENVTGHLGLGFDTVLADLARLGFDAEWSTVSACSVGAPHMRERLFCLAYPESFGWDGWKRNGRPRGGESARPSTPTHWDAVRQPGSIGLANGLRPRVVQDQLHCLGNAVVPQVAEYVGRRIMAVAA